MANKWIKKFFGIDEEKENDVPRNSERVDMLSGGVPTFTPFNSNAYESDLFRASVDAVARNAGKLRGKHIVYAKSDNKRLQGDNELNRILDSKPNPYMTAYDMIYKLVTHLYIHNNAFAYLQKDDRGDLKGIYPLSPQNVEFIVDGANHLYCKFLFANSKELTLPYDEVFIVRRFFNGNDLLGDDNEAILSTLNVAHTQNEGISQSIKSSANIKGILKYNQVLSSKQLKEEKEIFTRDYLNISNNGGVAVLDQKSDYIPINNDTVNIDNGQMEAVKQKVYDYVGINESIVNSNYSENEWDSFYESVLEPIATQFSMELSNKVFTDRERAFGNTIVFESNRLQFASTQSKKDLISELVPYGLMTINEAREILNMPPVSDGDNRLQTLNVVDQDNAREYQMNKSKQTNDDIQEGDNDEGNPTHGNTGTTE